MLAYACVGVTVPKRERVCVWRACVLSNTCMSWLQRFAHHDAERDVRAWAGEGGCVYTCGRASARVQLHYLRQRITSNISVSVSRLTCFRDRKAEDAEATGGSVTGANGRGGKRTAEEARGRAGRRRGNEGNSQSSACTHGARKNTCAHTCAVMCVRL